MYAAACPQYFVYDRGVGMKRWLIFFLMLVLLNGTVQAVDLSYDYVQEFNLDQLTDAMPEEAEDILSGYDFTGQANVNTIFSDLGRKIENICRTHFASAAKSGTAVFTVVVLCSLASAFFPEGKAPGYVTIAGVLAIATAVLTDSGSFLRTGVQTLSRLSDFSAVLLPCLATVTAAGGAVVSASAKYAAAMLFMNVLLTVCTRIFVPLISVYLACIVAQAAFQSQAFSAVAGFLKWLCVTGLTLLVVIFTAYLSISGVITSSGDLVTTRFTKAAISTALPVVGKLVSDAASTVMAGISLVRSSVGVFGVIAVLCVTITPFLSMGIRYLLFKAAASAASIFPDQRFSALIDGIGTAFGLMMAMTGTGALILIISLTSFIKAVTG